jgi:hypothetical protein
MAVKLAPRGLVAVRGSDLRTLTAPPNRASQHPVSWAVSRGLDLAARRRRPSVVPDRQDHGDTLDTAHWVASLPPMTVVEA